MLFDHGGDAHAGHQLVSVGVAIQKLEEFDVRKDTSTSAFFGKRFFRARQAGARGEIRPGGG